MSREATANRQKLDLGCGGPGTHQYVEIAENWDAKEADLGTRWVAGMWCGPRLFAWEAEALPLDNTR
jgi:hypothetical protein